MTKQDALRWFCRRCRRPLNGSPSGDTVTAPKPTGNLPLSITHDQCGGHVLLSSRGERV